MMGQWWKKGVIRLSGVMRVGGNGGSACDLMLG